MAISMPDRLRPVADFTVQVVIGAVMFTVVFMVAVVLAIIVHWVEASGWAPKWVVSTAEYAEMLLYAADLFGFVLFLLKETLTLVRSLWLELRQ